MTEINGHIYKRALMNAEDKLKERGKRIAELKSERDALLAENAKLREECMALAKCVRANTTVMPRHEGYERC